MILVLHIIIALTSLVVTALAYMVPKRLLLNASYLLAALTIMSGTYIAVSNPAHMAQACVSGLVYTGIVMLGLTAVRRKMTLHSN